MFNKSKWGGWVIFAIVLSPLVYTGIILIPRPEKITTIDNLTSHLDGLIFPPQTALLDAGMVNKKIPFTYYSYGSGWGVVRMPRNAVAKFLTQASVIPMTQVDVKECRDWVLTAPQRQRFYSDEWNAASVKHYKVCWFAGKSVSILVDLDDPAAARVYMNLN